MDLHAIDLNLLVAFRAFMAERSVTKAGVRIGRTQPAMSAALARLRHLLKDELFVRGPEGLVPTQRALDLAEPIGHALAEIERSLAPLQSFDPASATGSFSIALGSHPATVLLPALVETLARCAPGITLHIRGFQHRDELIRLLDEGAADAAVGVEASFKAARILQQPLFTERYVCVMRRNHPLAKADLDLDGFVALDHLLVSPEDDRRGAVDVALERIGRQRRLAVTLPQMHAAPRIVAHTDLIATLMERVVDTSEHRGELVKKPPPVDLPSVGFLLHWHRRNDAQVQQRWLREQIVAAAAGLTPTA